MVYGRKSEAKELAQAERELLGSDAERKLQSHSVFFIALDLAMQGKTLKHMRDGVLDVLNRHAWHRYKLLVKYLKLEFRRLSCTDVGCLEAEWKFLLYGYEGWDNDEQENYFLPSPARKPWFYGDDGEDELAGACGLVTFLSKADMRTIGDAFDEATRRFKKWGRPRPVFAGEMDDYGGYISPFGEARFWVQKIKADRQRECVAR